MYLPPQLITAARSGERTPRPGWSSQDARGGHRCPGVIPLGTGCQSPPVSGDHCGEPGLRLCWLFNILYSLYHPLQPPQQPPTLTTRERGGRAAGLLPCPGSPGRRHQLPVGTSRQSLGTRLCACIYIGDQFFFLFPALLGQERRAPRSRPGAAPLLQPHRALVPPRTPSGRPPNLPQGSIASFLFTRGRAGAWACSHTPGSPHAHVTAA